MPDTLVLCLSGGLDSSILAALLRDSHDIQPLFFDYGQPPVSEERTAALSVVRQLGLRDLTQMTLPRIALKDGLGQSFFAFRNLILASHALAFAESNAAKSVAFGFVADTDPRLYPDATSGFSEALSLLATNYYASPIRLLAPVASLRKAELIVQALRSGFDFSSTYSCYRGGERCGACSSCQAVIHAYDEAESSVPDQAHFLRETNPYRPGISVGGR